MRNTVTVVVVYSIELGRIWKVVLFFRDDAAVQLYGFIPTQYLGNSQCAFHIKSIAKRFDAYVAS